MNIVSLTTGAAGMYCGGCMRDNALTAALRRLGHDALQIPLYTPLKVDEADNSIAKVFFGGVNVYLQQNTKILSRLPEWLDKRIDSPGFLRFATSFGIQTKPEMLGAMTISMLQGEHGKQVRELTKLTRWMAEHCKPDAVILSNVLMVGMARQLRAELKAPVFCTLQGEDFFLDHLPEKDRDTAWAIASERARELDGVIGVSRYYADLMARRLGLPAEKVFAVLNGIELADYAPPPERPAARTVVYFARMAPEKGLGTLVEAYKLLRAQPEFADVKLRAGGSLTGPDAAYVRGLEDDLRRAGLKESVEFLPNLDKAAKVALLRSGTVFSVPATYGEAFGLYLLEALACGVPVVQPRHAAFPEILAETGGGVLCEPGDAKNLAEALAGLLRDRARAARLGDEGRRNVVARFGVDRAARELVEILARARAKMSGT
jgi:glycosyltransferase involved in cell wall biosynthesis